MIARLAGLFAICALTTGAAMAPDFAVTPAREIQAVSRLAGDGDLQGDDKVLDARARFDGVVRHGETFWWVPRVALGQANCPALTTSSEGGAGPRSVLERARVLFGASEWLEAVWAAVRSVLELGRAWSRSLLFGRG